MKYFNKIIISIFVKIDEGENLELIKQKLLDLFPFNLVEEKLTLKEETNKGFNERRIKILTVELLKESHTNKLFESLLRKITRDDKSTILRQKELRLDQELYFYLRFDKQKWIQKSELELTDSGDCFHIKLALAAFPRKREVALDLINNILSLNNNSSE